GVDDVDVAAGVHRQSEGRIELPIAGPERAPLREIDAGIREFLDSVVAVFRNVDVASSVRGHVDGMVELSIGSAIRTPLGQVTAGTVELLDAVVEVVC